jgi:hypothetical protein
VCVHVVCAVGSAFIGSVTVLQLKGSSQMHANDIKLTEYIECNLLKRFDSHGHSAAEATVNSPRLASPLPIAPPLPVSRHRHIAYTPPPLCTIDTPVTAPSFRCSEVRLLSTIHHSTRDNCRCSHLVTSQVKSHHRHTSFVTLQRHGSDRLQRNEIVCLRDKNRDRKLENMQVYL